MHVVPPLPLTAIVATSLRNGIGLKGTLPWRLAKDMAYFRDVTRHVDVPDHDVSDHAPLKNAVIMGRHTWESIPPKFRPLRGRINVVVSTTMTNADLGLVEPCPDTFVACSLDEAAMALQQRLMWRSEPHEHAGSALAHAFLIGGAALYEHALTAHSSHWVLDSLLVTRIIAPTDLPCDVFMTEFRSPQQIAWEEQMRATDSGTCPHAGSWRQAAPDVHLKRFSCLNHEHLGILQDNGYAIQFQYWQRS